MREWPQPFSVGEEPTGGAIARVGLSTGPQGVSAVILAKTEALLLETPVFASSCCLVA